ncbi:MAG: aspartate 1-decarboxylase [Planctomycetota bacterium]
MQRIMLRAKIHRATVTRTELEYEGSLTVDRDLMDAAGMLPGEQVHVVNLNNGARIETYLISGRRKSGEICLNGPAARTGMPGDRVIVLTYAPMDEAEARAWKPLIVHVDGRNRIRKGRA